MSSPISTGVKFNFNYSFESKQLTVYVNLNKLVDLKLNLINNNLNINLNDDDNDDENQEDNEDTASSDKVRHVEREKKSTNLNELLYLIVDELDTKVRSSLAADDSQSANAIALMNNLYFLKYFLLVSEEFKHKLKHFLHAKYNEYYAGKYTSAMRELGPDRSDILKRYWGDITRALANSLDEMNLNNINILGKMYHKLMHSNYMNLILKQEYLYTIEYNKKLNQFMLLGSTNDQDELWSTRIESLKTKQQRLFSKFLFKLYDELNSTQGSKSNNSGSGLSSSNSQVSMKLDINDYLDKSDLELDVDDLSNVISLNKIKFINTDNNSNTSGEEQQQQQQQLPLGDETAPGGKKNQPRRFADQSFTRIEESYTIQLGAQLKTTHNLRLIRCDILDYCKDRFKLNAAANDPSNLFSFVELHTISTAMSLFSENKLCALVLLVDCCLDKAKLNFPASSSASDDVSSKFFQICHKNGYDFQFQSIEQQIEAAIDCINGVNAAKNAGKTGNSCLAKMNIGDFFITKHSNLSQTHIVFHLAAYDSSAQDSEQHNNTLKKSDLSSRHPVILGLRNILKTCINHNIQTLTFPLLLSHQMTEEMTINWVMKRAELVLKCIKGFMIEFVQWGSQDSRDLQFVVPQGLIDETFNSVSSLVKTIFRESRAYLLQ